MAKPSRVDPRRSIPRTRRVMSLAALFSIGCAGTAFAQVAVQGQWSQTVDWPMVAIHAAVLPDGKVMTMGSTPQGLQGGLDFDVWDPKLGLGPEAHVTKPNIVNMDSFCAATVLQPWNGMLMIVGGGTNNQDDTFKTGLFNWKSQTLDLAERAAYQRWYATTTTLPDGRILMQGGGPAYANHTNSSDVAEIYAPGQGWRVLDGTFVRRENNGGDEERWYYPRMWPVAGNKAAVIAGKVIYELNYAGNGAIQNMQRFDKPNWGATSTAVMYAPKKVLQLGGGAKWADTDAPVGSKAATLVDLSRQPYATTETAPMAFGRHWPTATVLPTGDVLVTGGSEGNNGWGYDAAKAAYAAELWSPKTGRWTTLASFKVPRLYHSSAMLLPDGRIFSGGGGVPGPVYGKSAEVFTPPYLFDASGAPAARPAITTEPGIVRLGQSFDVKVKGNRPISRFTLVKTGAVTHGVNMDQRFLEMPFTGAGGVYRLTMTADPIDATPGYYMLFALDDKGVPSTAKMLRIPSPIADNGEAPPASRNNEPTGTDPVADNGGNNNGGNGGKNNGGNNGGGGETGGSGNKGTAPANGAIGTIAAVHSELCLSVKDGSGADGARLTQETCNGSAAQKWSWKAVEGGYTLLSGRSDKCIGVLNAGTVDGAALVLAGCTGGDNQIWKPTPSPTGLGLVSKSSGKCMDVFAVSREPGAQVYQWTCHGQANQAWKVTARVETNNTPPAQPPLIGWDASKVASAADGTTLVINKDTGTVWQYGGNRNWNALAGRAMAEIATGGSGRIYGIGTDGNPYRWNGNAWIRVGYNSRTISVASDGTVVVTNPQNEIWVKVADDLTENWTRMAGTAAKVVAIAANRFWSMGMDNNVYRSVNGSWTQFGYNVSDIAASSDGGVAVVNRQTREVWLRAGEDGQWKQAGIKALQVSAPSAKQLITIDTNNGVNRLSPNG